MPYADTSAAVRRLRPKKAAFDSKMIHLKGDLVVNDNAWSETWDVDDDENKAEVSTQADNFIATFDKVCRKHDVKKAVHKYSSQYHAALDCKRTPDESTCMQLAQAQKCFRKAKKNWQVRVRQQFYARVADDFVANDHKNVWSRLRVQVNLSSVVEVVNPVKNWDGALQHHADKILEVMKEHYEDLLTYDPEKLSTNREHWATLDLGEPVDESDDLNESLTWPEILLTIQGMNRNTAPGKDEIHINVLKIMVREECMAALKSENLRFKWPDNVFVNLSESELKRLLKTPLTELGKSFHALLEVIVN
ncbi:hypothetical protein H4582DRAFT_2087106 [Lactarius indigo]|nr:hypothetical protein H4582DRAFT_2087106 [Lactarius indigo]